MMEHIQVSVIFFNIVILKVSMLTLIILSLFKTFKNPLELSSFVLKYSFEQLVSCNYILILYITKLWSQVVVLGHTSVFQMLLYKRYHMSRWLFDEKYCHWIFICTSLISIEYNLSNSSKFKHKVLTDHLAFFQLFGWHNWQIAIWNI